ncbi:hypothetical protein PFISCL1PPCAC_6766, partial [Pristionchus fissidentatus]
MPHYKLTYFDLRGRGEPIRMMFAIAGVPLEDHRIKMEEWGPDFAKTTPFAALPMIEIDGVKIAQTVAILRYIAREKGFAGSDNLSAALADSLADQYSDFINAFVPWHIVNAGYAPGDKDALYKSAYMPARAKHFPFFEEALRKSTTGWIANTPELTHADVFIASGIEMLLSLDPNADKLFEGFPLFEAHYKKFFAHPKLQKYLEERPDAKQLITMPHYKLTYFDLRGRGEPIRMMFAIAGIPFEDRRIVFDEWADVSKSSFIISITFPCHSSSGYAGSHNLSAALADSLADQYADFMNAFMEWHIVNVGYAPGDKDALYKSKFVPARAKHFPFFEEALKKSTTGWFANTPELTHADVLIGALLEVLKRYDSQIFIIYRTQ